LLQSSGGAPVSRAAWSPGPMAMMMEDQREESQLLTPRAVLDETDEEFSKRVEYSMQEMEFKGELTIETDSVYGAVIAMPQITRSLGWNQTFFALTFRSFLLLAINYVFQISALVFLTEESLVMDVLGGKMHLCDYGRTLEDCDQEKPQHGCKGPGGTVYTPPRLYGYDTWAVRKWTRDTLASFFEDDEKVKNNIMDMNKIDPGEYGMENHECRIFACFLFTLAEVQGAFKILELIGILFHIPTKNESWVYWAEDGDDLDPLNNIKFRIAGMSLGWKLFNLIFIVFPKIWLLVEVFWMGFRFLMDTAGIVDLVLGAMAMDFVLSFDELILESFEGASTKHIMEHLEHFTHETDEEHLNEHIEGSGSGLKYGAIKLAIPRRLIIVLVVLLITVEAYYRVYCTWNPNSNSWESVPTKLPATTHFSLKNLLTYSVPFGKDDDGNSIYAWQPIEE